MFGSRAQVQCIDADCNLSGYKTAGMLSACPDVVDCTVVNFLKDNSGQINLSNQVINQNCSLTKTTSGTSTTSTNTNSSTSTVADDGTTKTFASSQTSSSTSEPPLPQTGNVSAQQPSPSDIVPPPEEQQGQQEERREQQTDSAGLSTFHIVLIILGAILLAIAIGVASYKFWPSKP
jgi:cobalamin biosynthesis Mg chelatase CobN